tara:strand:+ start:761 stop:991 length:231 start_codon:yes stop_codon:yes gene_type:complete
MIDADKYETMTQHDLIEILNHWEQLAFQKTNEVKRLRKVIYDALYVLQTDGWNKNRTDAINRLEKVLINGWEGEEE